MTNKLLSISSEKAMATDSSTLAWKIPWMEEPGRLQSMGSLSRTRLRDFTFTFHFHALEKEMATHSSSCLGNPRDRGPWWAAVSGVAQSRTRLKRLSSSSSIHFVSPSHPYKPRMGNSSFTNEEVVIKTRSYKEKNTFILSHT